MHPKLEGTKHPVLPLVNPTGRSKAATTHLRTGMKMAGNMNIQQSFLHFWHYAFGTRTQNRQFIPPSIFRIICMVSMVHFVYPLFLGEEVHGEENKSFVRASARPTTGSCNEKRERGNQHLSLFPDQNERCEKSAPAQSRKVNERGTAFGDSPASHCLNFLRPILSLNLLSFNSRNFSLVLNEPAFSEFYKN